MFNIHFIKVPQGLGWLKNISAAHTLVGKSPRPFRLNFSDDNHNSIFICPVVFFLTFSIYTWPGICIFVDNYISVWASKSWILLVQFASTEILKYNYIAIHIFLPFLVLLCYELLTSESLSKCMIFIGCMIFHIYPHWFLSNHVLL